MTKIVRFACDVGRRKPCSLKHKVVTGRQGGYQWVVVPADRLLKMFSAEIGVHYPGLKNLDKLVGWVFPSLLLCLDCGFTELSIPEEQRQELRRLDSEPTQGFVRAG